MNKLSKLTAAAAVLMLTALPVFAETEQDNLIVVHVPPKQIGSGSALCDVINVQREAAGVSPLTQSVPLMEKAAERVQKLAGNQGGADAAVLAAECACETVIRGRADINTAISAMIISEQQQKPLVCAEYTQFGFSSSEDETLWVFLFTA